MAAVVVASQQPTMISESKYISSINDNRINTTKDNELKPKHLKSSSLDVTLTSTNNECNNTCNNVNIYNNKYNAKESLLLNGIIVTNKITSTLQGSIYLGKLLDSNQNIVIKRTDIVLHERNLGKLKNNDVYTPVNENIVKESQMMMYIQNNINISGNNISIPNGILKTYKFVQDRKNYFLIMEYGGNTLYKHVIYFQDLLNNNKISINEWKLHCKILFTQMLQILYWLHNIKRVCHLDISMENITIKDFEFKDGKFYNHGQIYFIDYGLSEYFPDNNNFLCAKFVGKKSYQAPELVLRNGLFDARKADIWSLGIVMFMMYIGSMPMEIAHESDRMYCNIINGHLQRFLIDHGKSDYVSKSFINIMNQMLCKQNKRSFVENLISHEFLYQL